jgi:hypothetical protein
VITLEFNKESDAHVLILDTVGIDQLMKVLSKIKGKPDDHIHFMTSARRAAEGPADEPGDKPHGGNILLDHLIIYSIG